MINQERLAKLATISLKSGQHRRGDAREMCALEAVAWVAGEEWSDHPECACPSVSEFLRSWNDSLSTDAERDRLLAGTEILSTAGSALAPTVASLQASALELVDRMLAVEA